MPDPVVVETVQETIVEAPVVETSPVEEPVQTVGTIVTESTPEPLVTSEPKGRSAQRRIDEITRQKHDAIRDAEYWRNKATQVSPVTQPSVTKEPTPEGYDTQEDYIRAAARWEAHQVQREAEESGRAKQAEVERGKVLNEFQRQITKARIAHEDFDDVISQPMFTPAMQEAIFDSELGAEIAYYLGTHEEEAYTISQLSPTRAIREITRLESKLTPAAVTTPLLQPRRVSVAPVPITPLSGGATAVADPSRMTTDEWMAWDRQQKMERLKARPF